MLGCGKIKPYDNVLNPDAKVLFIIPPLGEIACKAFARQSREYATLIVMDEDDLEDMDSVISTLSQYACLNPIGIISDLNDLTTITIHNIRTWLGLHYECL